MAQSIITNTAYAAAGRAVNVGLGIVATGLMSRLLGAGGFGIYTTIFTLGTLLQIAADLGLYLTLTRAVAQHPTQENQYLGSILAIRLVLLGLLFGGGALVLVWFEADMRIMAAYGFVALGCAAQSVSQLFMGIYQKYGLIWRATVGDITGRVTQVIGIVAAGTAAGVATMAGMFAASGLVAAGLHYRLLPARVTVKLRFNWPEWRYLVADSVPLGALLIFNAIYFRIDIILLSLLQGTGQTGLYGLAYRLIESALFLPAMFGGLLLPRLSAAWQERRQGELERYVSQGLFAAIVAAAFVVVSLVMLAEPIVLFLGGAEFAAAAPLLRILSLALGAMFIGNIFGFTLVACHRQRAMLILAAVLTVFNLTLNVLLIPRFGAVASAWITVATELIAVSTGAVLIHRLMRLAVPRELLIRLPLATAACALTYSIVPAAWPVVVTVILGAAVFLLSSWWLKLFTRDNLSALLAAS